SDRTLQSANPRGVLQYLEPSELRQSLRCAWLRDANRCHDLLHVDIRAVALDAQCRPRLGRTGRWIQSALRHWRTALDPAFFEVRVLNAPSLASAPPRVSS